MAVMVVDSGAMAAAVSTAAVEEVVSTGAALAGTLADFTMAVVSTEAALEAASTMALAATDSMGSEIAASAVFVAGEDLAAGAFLTAMISSSASDIRSTDMASASDGRIGEAIPIGTEAQAGRPIITPTATRARTIIQTTPTTIRLIPIARTIATIVAVACPTTAILIYAPTRLRIVTAVPSSLRTCIRPVMMLPNRIL